MAQKMPVKHGLTKEVVKRRIKLLQDFKGALLAWGRRYERATSEQLMKRQVLRDPIPPDQTANEAREVINMNLMAVRQAVHDVGAGGLISIGSNPPMDPFLNIFHFEDRLEQSS
jgi:hypothetical protein